MEKKTIAEGKANAMKRRPKKGGKLSPSDKKTLAVVVACVAALLVLILLLYGVYYVLVVQNAVIPKNLHIAGINVGGLTENEAVSLLEKKVGDSYEKTSMTVTIMDQEVEITPEESGAKLDIKQAVKLALNHKSMGKFGENNLDITACLNLNEAVIREKLEAVAMQFSSSLKQTVCEIEGHRPSLDKPDDSADGMVLVIHKGTPEYTLNLEKLYQQVIVAYCCREFAPEVEYEIIEPDMPNFEAIYEQNCVAPVNATLDKETFDVIPAIYGYAFDIEDAKIIYEATEYGEDAEVPFRYITPDVQTEALSGTLYADVLGTATCKATSDANRNTNMSIACKKINDVTLFPGDVFSFNKTVGKVSAGNGFKTSYCCNGEDGDEIGAGLCQVASALYSCVLQAELSVLEVSYHNFVQEYADIGLDAKVSWGVNDLQFVNDTNYPIKLEASTYKGSVTITLKGTSEREYTVKLVTKIVKTLEYAVEYETMTPDNPEHYKDGDVIVTPINGYQVDIYLRQQEKAGAYDTNVLINSRNYSCRNKVVCDIVEPPTEPPETQPETTEATLPVEVVD